MTPDTRSEEEGQAEPDLPGAYSAFERHKVVLEGLLPVPLLEPPPLGPGVVARLQEAGRLWAEVVERLARAGVRPPGSSSGGARARRPREPGAERSAPHDVPGMRSGGVGTAPMDRVRYLVGDPPEDELVQELARYFLEANLVMAERLLDSRTVTVRSSDPEAELPEAEAEVLRSVGASFSPLGEEDEDPELAYEASYARLLATALDTKGAAERLRNVTDGYVRQRLESGTLYGVKLGRAWRLPLFQFTESGEVPGIKEVLPLLDPKLNPVAVERWFGGLPKPELYDQERGRELSPREWLLSGHGPEALKPMAGDL